MLNYEEFKEKIKDDILDYLPDDYLDSEIKLVQAVKNNDRRLDGLMIRRRNCNVSPNIYLNAFYDDYVAGREVDDILKSIVDIRLQYDVEQGMDADAIMNFERIKDHIYLSVCNIGMNRTVLSERPYRTCFDMAIMCYVNVTECAALDTDITGRLIMNITEDLLDIYKISEDELFEIAKKNTARMENVNMRSLKDELVRRFGRIDGDDEDVEIEAYVLTNKDGIKGAALIVCDEVMAKIADKIDSGFYILPVSVDEVIIVPEHELPQKAIDCLANEGPGPESDEDGSFLSQSLFYFGREEGKLSLVKCAGDVKV